MKRLGRKCKCGTVMLIDVEDDGIVEVNATTQPNRSSIRYRDVELIEGCALSLLVGGVVFDMPILNEVGVKAVYCLGCYGIRHLNLFEIVKV